MSLSGLLDSIFLRPLESAERAREMGFCSAGCFFLSTELTLRHLEEKYVMQTLNEEYVRFTYTRNFKFRQGSFFLPSDDVYKISTRNWRSIVIPMMFPYGEFSLLALDDLEEEKHFEESKKKV